MKILLSAIVCGVCLSSAPVDAQDAPVRRLAAAGQAAPAKVVPGKVDPRRGAAALNKALAGSARAQVVDPRRSPEVRAAAIRADRKAKADVLKIRLACQAKKLGKKGG